MAVPSFFKQNKPRGFNYIPRYYDPAKEEREQRRRGWNTERADRNEDPGRPGPADSDTGSMGTENGQPYRSKIMRGDMKNYFHRSRERVEKHTTIRLLVIILIIVLVVYLYLRFL